MLEAIQQMKDPDYWVEQILEEELLDYVFGAGSDFGEAYFAQVVRDVSLYMERMGYDDAAIEEELAAVGEALFDGLKRVVRELEDVVDGLMADYLRKHFGV